MKNSTTLLAVALVATICVWLLVLHRYWIIYQVSLIFSTCKPATMQESIQKSIQQNCRGVIVNQSDMSAPANTLRLGWDWEEWMTPLIRQYCRPDACAIDIGAHIGIHTRAMASYAGRVIAFEPNPQTYDVLVQNTQALTNIAVYNVAVGDKTGTASFEIKPMNCQSQLKAEHFDVTVAMVDLDSFVGLSDGCVSFIKIDVEGHEIKAFKGMQRLIDTCRPAIVFEDHTGQTKKYLESRHGYMITQLNRTNYLAR